MLTRSCRAGAKQVWSADVKDSTGKSVITGSTWGSSPPAGRRVQAVATSDHGRNEKCPAGRSVTGRRRVPSHHGSEVSRIRAGYRRDCTPRIRARSSSVCPPHTPYGSRARSACFRQSAITGQRSQMAFARAARRSRAVARSLGGVEEGFTVHPSACRLPLPLPVLELGSGEPADIGHSDSFLAGGSWVCELCAG